MLKMLIVPQLVSGRGGLKRLFEVDGSIPSNQHQVMATNNLLEAQAQC